jgi:predicted dehydrogenase
MRVRMAQYGIAHAHAAGKTDAMKRNPDVDFCGVFEPDPQILEERGSASGYKDVHWFKSKEEMLEDDSIVGIAVEGKLRDNLTFAREAIEHGKHIWLDKPAGDDMTEFRDILTRNFWCNWAICFDTIWDFSSCSTE